MRIPFDPWLIETEAALWGLGEYLDVIEEQILLVDAQRRTRLEEELARSGAGWDEAQLHMQELDLLVEHVFPRGFRVGFVLTLWGAFEAGVTEVATGLTELRHLRLKLRDIRGEAFLDRATKYFDNVLLLPLVESDDDAAKLNDLLKVRNSFAHANGRLRALNDQTARAVQTVIDKGVGLSVEWGDVAIDASFCRTNFALVDRCLRSLVSRARSSRKP